jgi:hypothetical protein
MYRLRQERWQASYRLANVIKIKFKTIATATATTPPLEDKEQKMAVWEWLLLFFQQQHHAWREKLPPIE